MKLRYYETMFLLDPDLNEEDREDAIQKFSNIITEDKGQIVNIDKWPLRKLAYKVQKKTQGYYVVMNYGAPGQTIQELTRNFRLDERVMKFITTKLDDEFDFESASKDFDKKESGASKEALQTTEEEQEGQEA